MKKKSPVILSRPHEQSRQVGIERRLARIRIHFTVFCIAVVFAMFKYLKISLVALLIFSLVSLLYGFGRYFMPAPVAEARHLPPAIDWLDLVFVGVLIYITGGMDSIFYVAFAIPICGGAMRFGLRAGIVGYIVSLGLTGSMCFINKDHFFVPQYFYIIASMGTLAFAAWMMGLLAENEWKLREEIYLSSITDHLSGLYNSGYLRVRIKEEVERCSRANISFALSFIDLDNFRLVNDQYGHLIGDKVLRQVAEIFAQNIRESDVLARYGGDEFVLLMPGTELQQAEKIMQRIEDAVTTSVYLENIKISFSNGVVVFPSDGDSLDKLLTAADTRMYEKKEITG